MHDVLEARPQPDLSPVAGKPAPDALDEASAHHLFAHGRHRVPVPLRRPPQPRLLWLNRRLLDSYPAWTCYGGNEEAVASHLLQACAWIVADEDDGQGVQAWADRYGGEGLDSNGGSGRAVVVNGYLVKGVGRTPLVGRFAKASHASGGAYLEEGLRELIFAEIMAAELPHGAIPILALIDTGLLQFWGEDSVPRMERRVLIVRPCILRPAHFERACGFISHNAREGALDHERVCHLFAAAGGLWGTSDLLHSLQEFIVRWAEQLAYAFVHRLSLAAHTTSNICLSGALLDFGAATAVPSWARVRLLQGMPPFGAEFTLILSNAESLFHYLGRCQQVEHDIETARKTAVRCAFDAYIRTIASETLRLCGLPREQAQQHVEADTGRTIYAAVRSVRAYFEREQTCMIDFTPDMRLPWNLQDLWLEHAPRHLQPLRATLRRLAGADQFPGLRQRAGLHLLSRPGLYREEFKNRLHAMLDGQTADTLMEGDALEWLVCREIAAGRRDSRLDLHAAALEGFAVAPQFCLALFRCTRSAQLLALIEWQSPGFFAAGAACTPDLYLSSASEALVVAGANGQGLRLGYSGSLFVPCAVHCLSTGLSESANAP